MYNCQRVHHRDTILIVIIIDHIVFPFIRAILPIFGINQKRNNKLKVRPIDHHISILFYNLKFSQLI